MTVRAVILAAGESKRMGAQKLLMDFQGKPMIEYALAAAHDWNPLVVAGREVADFLGRHHPRAAVLVNEEPQLGMSHSLALADGRIDRAQAFIVLLADKPQVTAALIQTVCDAAADADIAYPVRGEVPGHPVFFSPKARTRIAALPRGDSISLIRDDPGLVRLPLEIDDPGAFFDIDTPPGLTGT